MPVCSYVKIPAANEDLLKASQAQTYTWAIALASPRTTKTTKFIHQELS